MSDLPYSDPSNPALPSPLFSDITAVRGDHLRANNAAIFADLNALNARNPELVALTSGSFKTAALANANTYNGRSLFTCTAAVTDTPAAAAWRIVGYWNPVGASGPSGRFVAMADTSLETWEINYSGAAWGAWTRLTDASGNVTRDVIGNVTGHADSILETGTGAGIMRTKIIEIGDWNMDATASVLVPHGLDRTKIRTWKVTIRNDAGLLYDLSVCNDAGVGAGYSSVYTDATPPYYYIRCYRVASGVFDTTDFDSTSYNRGWVIIEYID